MYGIAAILDYRISTVEVSGLWNLNNINTYENRNILSEPKQFRGKINKLLSRKHRQQRQNEPENTLQKPPTLQYLDKHRVTVWRNKDKFIINQNDNDKVVQTENNAAIENTLQKPETIRHI